MYRFFVLFIILVVSAGIFVYTSPALLPVDIEPVQEIPPKVITPTEPREQEVVIPMPDTKEVPVVSKKKPEPIVATFDPTPPPLIRIETPPQQAEPIEEPAPEIQNGYSIDSLTQIGIITWTNMFRASNNISQLSANSELSSAATAKASDILTRQYFEHTAPDGTTASDLAKAKGYEYITVGENLALGEYKNDEDVVRAWMDSPGHKANILNTSYEEIGVGVVRGIYEGDNAWFTSCKRREKLPQIILKIYDFD